LPPSRLGSYSAFVSAPILIRRRTGRYGGLAVALLLGLGPLLAGVIGLAGHMSTSSEAFLRGFLYFAAASAPGLLGGALIALCSSELYLDPARRVFRLVSRRPWRRARSTEISFCEYAGLRAEGPDRRWGGRHVVYLVGEAGDDVPIQMFRSAEEALAFARRVGDAAGLWVRQRAF
jgi:hypothetical protein